MSGFNLFHRILTFAIAKNTQVWKLSGSVGDMVIESLGQS
ncbi:hypothetical protein P775_13990 [Puniceibacterium antarcticum]|uniref:Uncharacterized protein n=1 Tax=Puniceibacterium antarcticum TaxID=1206336 RepID=A0A2G8RDY1_9RHOB|nr:hypothetical protein P775_13990 [Puniceibacterium antarcticum]